jgi:hypothetical protein
MKTFSPVHIHEQIRRAPDIDFSHLSFRALWVALIGAADE